MNFLLHLVFELASEIWTCIFGHVVARVYLDMCCGVEDGYLNTIPGNEAEWPMFCRNVDSFLFWQISGSQFVHFLAKLMPKFSMNFGMTFATN